MSVKERVTDIARSLYTFKWYFVWYFVECWLLCSLNVLEHHKKSAVFRNISVTVTVMANFILKIEIDIQTIEPTFLSIQLPSIHSFFTLISC